LLVWPFALWRYEGMSEKGQELIFASRFQSVSFVPEADDRG